MSAQLNHTIVWCNDKDMSANFLAEMLGRPAPRPFGYFLIVELDNAVSMDFMQKDGPVALQHYAFLVDDAVFDAGFSHIRDLKIEYWADPARSKPNEINHHDGGRGVYFRDPSGHLLELITRPYGG